MEIWPEDGSSCRDEQTAWFTTLSDLLGTDTHSHTHVCRDDHTSPEKDGQYSSNNDPFCMSTLPSDALERFKTVMVNI